MSKNKVSLGIPELTPVFSFHSEGGGDVYVYLAWTEVTKFAIITFDDTSSEFAYAIQTITSSSKVEAEELVIKAAREWSSDEDNPFIELLRDKQAMERLHALLAQFFESGE
jgi:hypothetical protein